MFTLFAQVQLYMSSSFTMFVSGLLIMLMLQEQKSPRGRVRFECEVAHISEGTVFSWIPAGLQM